MPSTGQFTYEAGANHHGIKVFGHAVRFSIQWIARVTLQVQDTDMGGVYLF